MVLLNALAATYICFNIFLLLRMLRIIYLPTKKELETYSEEQRAMDKSGVLLYIPLTLTIGFFGFILNHLEKDEEEKG